MNINDYISKDFKAFRLDTPLYEVILFLKELPFSHFPIVENNKLIGVIDQEDLFLIDIEGKTLKDVKYSFQFYKTEKTDNCIDLISLFAQNNTEILPVTDENNDYLGYLELNDIIAILHKTPFLKQNSSSLIIERALNEYSLSEIAQIVESNALQLLGLYISKSTADSVQITLRVNTEEVNELIQSLRRYKYRVLSQNKDDVMIEEYKNRADYLDKYLNI
jgi:signal-transduction protein with cAMP-binding, CBS, and nucleotidyltransferase domain